MRKRAALLMVLVLVAVGCEHPYLITSPGEGAIIETQTVPLAGTIDDQVPGGTLTVDGIPFPVNPDGTWTATAQLDPDAWVSVVEVIYTEPSGIGYRHRRAFIFGQALVPGEHSPDGVGLHFTNAGLASLGPVIEDMASGSFDIEAQLMSQNPVINTTMSGLSVTGSVWEAGMDKVGLTTAATAAGMRTTITINDLFLGINLNIDVVGACKLEIRVSQATILGTFDLRPLPGNPSVVDVNMVGSPAVTLSGLSSDFISGACDPDTPVIGGIISGIAGGQIGGQVQSAFQTQLGDPDGAGPADSPIADAVETALAGLNISGDVGDALGVNLAAPMTAITETAQGLTLRSNADFWATVGAGPSDCPAVPHAPTFPSTVDLPHTFPNLGSTTPSGQPFGIGMVISASAFNQLLGAMGECGKFNQDLTSLDLGAGPVPLTAGFLSALDPAFGTLPPATPLSMRITPTAAPFLTDEAGPNGEAATLFIPNIRIAFIDQVPGVGDVTRLAVHLDAPLGFDLAYDTADNTLVPTIASGPAGSVVARVVENGIGANDLNIEALFTAVFPIFAADLGESFGAFPLPEFLGLQLSVVDVVRNGNSFVLYSNIAPVPQTRLANVTLTDTSTGDWEQDDAFSDSSQWRHRIRKQTTSASITTQYRSVIAADAIYGDESALATGNYRLGFDVIPAAGQTWRLDLSHRFSGAHTHKDEGCDGRSELRTPGVSGQTSHFLGRYRLNSGAWTYFNFNASTGTVTSGGSKNTAVTGQSPTAVVTGTAQTHVDVEYFQRHYAFSDGAVFCNGNEVAIRAGLNDTLANGFTAGEYPGSGNRVAADDGHFGTVTLTTL